MTALALSMFRNLYATKPEKRSGTVQDVAVMFSDWSRVVTREERARAVPLWSPVEYRDGATRNAAGVEWVHWLVLDYDDGATVEEVREKWKHWVHLGHTSYSHMRGREPTQEHPQGRKPEAAVRVALPLLEPIPGEDWSHVMRIIMADQGQEADKKCIDPSRMFYVPCLASRDAPRQTWSHMPSGGIDSPWLCLADTLEKARAAKRDLERRRRENLEKVKARARDLVDSKEDAEREIRRRLLEDPRAREDFGHMVGGSTVDVGDATSGALVRGVECPSCGRRSLWWVVSPRTQFRAACNHVKTCGYRGHLWEVAALHGVRVA